jgi:hypothetical protein
MNIDAELVLRNADELRLRILNAAMPPVNVGSSTSTTSPGLTSTRAMRSIPCCDPLVMSNCSRVAVMPSLDSTVRARPPAAARNLSSARTESVSESAPLNSEAEISRSSLQGKSSGAG